MTIALTVLSSILLILILGLLFHKEFRADVLKPGSENEAEFKGFKFKGAVFWVVYALTATGTIYLAAKPASEPISSCSPTLEALEAESWIPVSRDDGQPVRLVYGCEETTDTTALSRQQLNLDFVLDSTLELRVNGQENGMSYGKVPLKSLKALQLANDWQIKEYIEIYYRLSMEKGALLEVEKNTKPFYDWNGYENLPFTISIKTSTLSGAVYVDIKSKKGFPPLGIETFYLEDRRWKRISVNDRLFMVRLRSADLVNNGNEHANFQVLEVEGVLNGLGE